MKLKKIVVLVVAIMLASFVYAQHTTEVVETNGSFGNEAHPALATKVLFTDAKTVTNEFMSMIKSYKPENMSVKKGLLFFDNVVIPTISENAIDVFATVHQDKGSDVVDLVVAFSIGGNLYITSTQSPSQYQVAYTMIRTFANDLTEKNHAAMLKVAEKVLSKEEKKLESLEKKDASYQKSIEKAHKDIAKIEKGIAKDESKQNDVKSDIEKQRMVVREKKDAYKRIERM